MSIECFNSGFIVRNVVELMIISVLFWLKLFAELETDEFSGVLKTERIPKVLITTCRFNSTVRFPSSRHYD